MRKLGFIVCLTFAGSWGALAQAPAAPEERWPRELHSGGNHFVIYQPQVDRWKNDRLEARSAVMVTQHQPVPYISIRDFQVRQIAGAQQRQPGAGA